MSTQSKPKSKLKSRFSPSVVAAATADHPKRGRGRPKGSVKRPLIAESIFPKQQVDDPEYDADVTEIRRQVRRDIKRERFGPRDAVDMMDVQIAIGRIFNLTYERIGSYLQTPSAPAGCSRANVNARYVKNRLAIDSIVAWANKVRDVRIVEYKEIAAADMRAEMEKFLGTSWNSLMQAIKDGDLDTAKWHIEQVIGKPKQEQKITGSVAHGHIQIGVWPERKLIEQDSDITSSDNLLSALPQNAIDAATVDDDEDNDHTTN